MNDSRSNGFTIVELAVTIAVMSILIGIARLSLNAYQSTGRNEERKADASNIATYLDNAYINGYSRVPSLKGGYPSNEDLNTAVKIEQVFDGLDKDSLRAPKSEDYSLELATSAAENPALVSPAPSPDSYVYQPLKNDGSLCSLSSDYCRKFNLYYMLENDETIYKIASRNQ